MNRKFLVATFIGLSFLLYSCLLQAQISIHGCITGLPSQKVYLAEVNAGRTKVIDSVTVNRDCFDFYESDTLPVGMYFVILNPEKSAFVQLILNGKDVAFHSAFNNLPGNLVIDKSIDNNLLYEYIRRTQSGTSTNPSSAQKLADSIIHQYPHSLLSAILRSRQDIKYPSALPEAAKENYLYAHYFDNVDLNNTALIRTDVLTDLMYKYLGHYEDQNLTIPQQAERYAVAVDSLLYKTSVYPVIHNFFIKELSDKFRYGNFDMVGAYINEYYISQVCTNATVTSTKQRIANLKHTSVGKRAPEINMPSYDGTTLKMSDIKNDYLLIVFWSSYCFHCTQVLPKLKQVYDHRIGTSLEILAISTDTYQQEWLNFIKNENLTWINYCDLKGWDSDIAKNYNVQGTPTYLLLNKEKTIIAKPATLEELVTKLKELNLF